MSDILRVKNSETGDETTMTRERFDAWEERWPGEFVEVEDVSDAPLVQGTVVVTPADEPAAADPTPAPVQEPDVARVSDEPSPAPDPAPADQLAEPAPYVYPATPAE